MSLVTDREVANSSEGKTACDDVIFNDVERPCQKRAGTPGQYNRQRRRDSCELY